LIQVVPDQQWNPATDDGTSPFARDPTVRVGF
jgi:hypothetical protein